jgi:hypothetical protein
MPFAILHGQGGGMTVNNNSVGTIGVGSFYMPWAGNLSMTLTGVASWPQTGHQQWYLHLGNSSPGPNSASVLTQINLNNITTHRGQVPAYAMWLNLAKGQVVNFVLAVGVGGGGWNVSFEGWAATVKAWPG